MSVVSVEARSFILALFIRDDGERFLLGDDGYDFIDSQLHFVANTIENDEVEKQGADGIMLAGQVRRASVQTFDGYVGDATTPKDKIEEMRREFIAFFAKDHHFRVIYVDCNRNAWQRKGGYLVDAPEVKELWQIHPEYHVGLNFEDVNYYEYDENADGQEILANIMKVPISSDVEGGLVWDEDGAVSEDATVVYDGDTATASGKSISVSDAVEAPLADFQLKGETSQQTYTGKNLVYTSGKTDGGITATYNAATGETTISGTAVRTYAVFGAVADVLPAGTYTFSIQSAAPCSVGVATKASGGNRAGHPISTGATKTTFTISEDSEQYDIYLTGLTANTAYSFTFKAMLESGSTATTPFEPYTNGPAPNPSYPQTVNTVTGENVVKICGKNLWGAEEHGSINENTGEDVWNANRWRTAGYIPVKSNTAYTLSSNAPSDIWYIFCFYDSGKNFISGVAVYGGSQTQTTPANCEFMRCVVCDTASIKTTERQLELGSTATDFEPYQGQSYPVNFTPNLYDYEDRKKGYYIGSNGDEVSNSAWSITDYLPVVAGNIFGCSGMTNAGNAPRGAYYDSSKNLVSVFKQTAGNIFITIPSGVAFVRFSLNGYENDQTADWLKFKFFYNLELCKIGTYQDSIYKSGGKWYVRKEVGKYTFTGNESPSVDTASTNTTRCLINNCLPADAPAQPQATGTGKSNYFEYRTNWSDDVAGIYSNNRAIVFRGAKTTIGTTQDAVKTWLASTNPMYYYALATSTDTEITNAALIEQLEALAAATMHSPQTNITTLYADGNEQPTLDVSYFTDKNPDTRDELIIDSRLRTITLNGLDVYHLQAPGSEFLMLAPGENRLALQSDITGDNGYAQVSYKQGYLSI